MSEEFHKTTGPVILGFVCAMLVFGNYFFNVPALKSTVSIIRNNTILIAAFAAGLGAINLIMVNYRYFSTKRPGLWQYGPIYFIGFSYLRTGSGL